MCIGIFLRSIISELFCDTANKYEIVVIRQVHGCLEIDTAAATGLNGDLLCLGTTRVPERWSRRSRSYSGWTGRPEKRRSAPDFSKNYDHLLTTLRSFVMTDDNSFHVFHGKHFNCNLACRHGLCQAVHISRYILYTCCLTQLRPGHGKMP